MKPDLQSSTPSLRLQQIRGADGKGVITSWLSKYGDARARFHVRIGNMSRVPRSDWTNKQFHKLKDADGVAEIKWEAGNQQWRALGFDFNNFFVMLVGCTHKDDRYDPTNCINTAMRLKKETERGQHELIDYA